MYSHTSKNPYEFQAHKHRLNLLMSFHSHCIYFCVKAGFILGVALVLLSIFKTYFSHTATKTFWINSLGVLLVFLALFLSAGYNNTAYYPSSIDLQSSLTINNSSSSIFTLKVMSVVSLLIPIVLIYGAVAWRAMDKNKITSTEFEDGME